MNSLIKPLATASFFLATFCGPTAFASPLVSVGDKFDIFFSGSTSVRAMSNIFRTETNTDSDVLWILSPGLELRFGDGIGTNAQIVGNIRYDILRYSSNSLLNTENFSANAVTRFNFPRLNGSANVGFAEIQTSSGLRNVRDLIEYEEYRAGIEGEYDYSPKFSFGAGVNYNERNYKGSFLGGTTTLADRYQVSVPLDVYYELTPRLDLSLGYRYRYSDVDSREFQNVVFVGGVPVAVPATSPSYNSNAHFFNAGLRGELFPKVVGQLRVGYETIRFGETANRQNRDSLAVDANARWQATPKLGLTFGAGRDFAVAGEGDTVLSTRGSVGAVLEVTPLLSVQGDLRYQYRSFQNSDRSDDIYNVGIRSSYRLNEYWVLSGGYSFEKVDASGGGNNRGASYDNHIFDVSIGLRY